MKIRVLTLLAVALVMLHSERTVAEACLAADEDRQKVALVLGGGGARGIAHVGVIMALEELRVPVDLIAGTSMGALVGGMLATGMSAEEINTIATTIDWTDTFQDDIPRTDRPLRRKRDDALGLYAAKIGLGEESSILPRAAITGQKVDFLLESIVGYRTRSDDFDELPVPFRAVAVDIIAGEVAVLAEGNLARAMRASMSLPGVFDPVELENGLLVDGGVLMNLPVSVARDMGADVVIAVDVGEPLGPKEKIRNIVQILYQMTSVVTVVNTREQIELLGDDDFLLTPLVDSDIGSASFAESLGAIPEGYSAVMAERERLSRLAVSESDWSSRRARIRSCVDGPPVIDFVRIDNRSRFSDRMIRARIGLQPGDTLDLELLEREVQAIYSLGFLQSVQYSTIEEDGRTGLVIEVDDDIRGTQMFEYGFGINSSSRVSDFRLRAGFLKTDVGTRGGEFRSLLQVGQELGALVELWLPLDDRLRYYVVPRVIGEEARFSDFDAAGNKLQQFTVSQLLLGMEAGRAFGNDAVLAAGVRRGTGDITIEIGDPGFQPVEFERGEWVLRGGYDTQDNRFFPGSGNFSEFTYTVSDQDIGADVDFEQFGFATRHAWTIGRHSLLAGLEYDVSFDDVIPLPNLFRAGGFPRLSGLQYNELIGENFALLLGGYRYKMLESSFFPGYLGATVEYGNVARDRTDLFSNGILNGSVYFGFDSIIGPMYLGVGVAEGGRHTGFLSIGSIFSPNTLSGF